MPNEALAIAVATEWDAQRDTLKFYTMHLVWLNQSFSASVYNSVLCLKERPPQPILEAIIQFLILKFNIRLIKLLEEEAVMLYMQQRPCVS